MYQSACCLVNWAEVSRRRVGAKQEEEGGKKNKTEQSSWSRRDRVCVVPALNSRHGYGGGGAGGGSEGVEVIATLAVRRDGKGFNLPPLCG